ncbi:hypothetical protein Bbelb_327040 [Branchiostoma belcheri]|nr:hypothetical protein Bbelb_327040 [Branchiostoma belcheri]
MASSVFGKQTDAAMATSHLSEFLPSGFRSEAPSSVNRSDGSTGDESTITASGVPARDPVGARPECKTRSAPCRIPHGSRRETNRASVDLGATLQSYHRLRITTGLSLTTMDYQT